MEPTFRSLPDQEYKRFVVYVLNGCSNSAELLSLINKTCPQDVHVQNIEALPSRPEWLDGVPILANKDDMTIYRGSDAFRFVSNHVQTPPKRTSKLSSKHSSFCSKPHTAVSFSNNLFEQVLSDPPATPDNETFDFNKKLELYQKQRKSLTLDIEKAHMKMN
tara:strand:+ start:10401 stop:10886 length:486 start_codon:yes stop_codon:yes gene_type:complete